MSVRRPKLGQHFLHNPHFCYKIADSLDLHQDDLLVEIGAGRGDMTRLLAPCVRRLVAVELDSHLAAQLRDEFQQDSRIEVLEADILGADLTQLCQRYHAEQCFVFGNLPYYITSPILHYLFSARARVRHMALLMQREVAERLAAMPRSRAYGYLSVLTQCFSQAQIVLAIPPGAFSPPPKVQSALVDFRTARSLPDWDVETCKAFLDFVQVCFAKKRKSLLNNLAPVYPRPRVEHALEGLWPQVRAEQLSVQQFAGLFQCLR